MMYKSGPINGEQFDESGNSLTPPGVKTTGGDSYFWNGYYESCWTHFGHVIGDPLILPKGMHDGTWSGCLTNRGIENNRLKAHHFAMGGRLFRILPYKLMLTYSMNHGNYHAPYTGPSAWDKPWGSVKETGLAQFSFAFTGSISKSPESPSLFGIKGMTALYGIYADHGQLYRNSFGITLGLRYEMR